MNKLLFLSKMLAPLAMAVASTPAAATSSRRMQSRVDLTTCTPTIAETPSNFTIQLINMGSSSTDSTADNSRYIEAFEIAAERWQKVIVGDLPDFPAGAVDDWFQGAFSRPYNGAIDDLVIGYDISNTIDGVGGTLGRAGAVFVRTVQGLTQSTISGVMEFDFLDLERMPQDDVKAVILHEMGHVLGLVGVNGDCTSACDPSNVSRQGVYQCIAATTEFEALAPPDSLLILENAGGMGTACGHWEEDIFRTQASSELMTGFFEASLFQPLSLVTVAALDDIGGYQVDYCGADVWPADENTAQRFEVFRTQNNMDVSEMMEDIVPWMGMDESGNAGPIAGRQDSSAVTLHQGFFILFALALGFII